VSEVNDELLRLLHGLGVLLTHGRRSARALAQAGLALELGVDELCEQALAVVTAGRAFLGAGRAGAHEREYDVHGLQLRLALDRDGAIALREHPDGPLHASRYWLGPFIGISVALLLGAAIVASELGASSPIVVNAVLVVLAALVAVVAAEIAGRARRRETRLLALLWPVLAGVAVVLLPGSTELRLLRLAGLGTLALVGFLVGRGREHAPRHAHVEREHALRHNAAAQAGRRKRAEAPFAQAELEYASFREEAASILRGAVEELLRWRYAPGTELDAGAVVRTRNRVDTHISAWPNTVRETQTALQAAEA
jgi:hypothetical protein